MTELPANKKNGDSNGEFIPALTPREVQVLQLLAQGMICREAGVALGIAEFTVRGHVATLRMKLRARTIPHAVTIALQRGLLPTPEPKP